MTLNKDTLKKKQVKYLKENWWRVRTDHKNHKEAFADFGKRFGLHWRTIENWYSDNRDSILSMPPVDLPIEPNSFK